MVTHPVIGGHQLSVQTEITGISHMQFALLPFFFSDVNTDRKLPLYFKFKNIPKGGFTRVINMSYQEHKY